VGAGFLVFELLARDGSVYVVAPRVDEKPGVPSMDEPYEVQVVTQPNGALVMVEGQEVGTTPYGLTLAAGVPRLSASLVRDGYEPFDVRITRGTKKRLAVTLMKAVAPPIAPMIPTPVQPAPTTAPASPKTAPAPSVADKPKAPAGYSAPGAGPNAAAASLALDKPKPKPKALPKPKPRYVPPPPPPVRAKPKPQAKPKPKPKRIVPPPKFDEDEDFETFQPEEEEEDEEFDDEEPESADEFPESADELPESADELP